MINLNFSFEYKNIKLLKKIKHIRKIICKRIKENYEKKHTQKLIKFC